jgi:hypothetical protein
LCGYVDVLRFDVLRFGMGPSIIIRDCVGSRDERASHDGCINRGREVKEPISILYIIS